MNYVVTYRGKDGRPQELTVDAVNRNALFAELAKCGISAIKVSEGEGKVKKAGTARRGGISGTIKGVIAAVVVVVSTAVAWFVVSPAHEEEKSSERRGKPRLISETIPVSAGHLEEVVDAQGRESTPMPPQRPHEVRDGMLMLSNGELLPTNKLRKVSVEDRKPRFQYAIFDHSTDNELAAILMLRPGQALVGGPIRHSDYKADFLKAIETPIVVHKDDPEDVRDVKRAVIEARMMLKEAIDAGEDPADIIREAYEEAQKLALYKDDIRREVMNMAKDGDYTDQEVDDLIEAANKMLESKGIEPMNLGPVMKVRLRTLKR